MEWKVERGTEKGENGPNRDSWQPRMLHSLWTGEFFFRVSGFN